MPNIRNEINNSNIKFHNSKIDELLDMVMHDNSFNNISLLPVNERALIYTMWWCSSERANLPKYEFDRVLEMTRKLRNYLKE